MLRINFLLFFISTNLYSQACEQYKSDIKDYRSCSDKSIHLTFDDGPNTTTTPKVVETLKRQGVDATFFISTHQLTKGDLSKKKEIVKDMVSSGFTLASHGHDHNCHDIRYDWTGKLHSGYNDEERDDQISKSILLLDEFSDGKFSSQKNTLLRFPYGRGISPSKRELLKILGKDKFTNKKVYNKKAKKDQVDNYANALKEYRESSPAMKIASNNGLSHIGWNHDSKDASSTYSAKNKDAYLDNQIKSFCESSAKNIMTLYHDTREINSLASSKDPNKTVLDEMIERSKCLGIKFLSMDEILNKDLQAGVYTKAYPVDKNKIRVKRISKPLKTFDNIETTITKTCSVSESTKPKYQFCISKYDGKVEHCDGKKFFCIDGDWIESKQVRDMACTNKISNDTAIKLSKEYLNKKCSKDQISKRWVIEEDKVSCYCLENDNQELFWQCSDITSGSPIPIN